MLTAIRTADAKTVLARNTLRQQGPYRCRCCDDEAILVKGPIRVHHFRHRPDAAACRAAMGESLAHLTCKDAIYHALLDQPNVRDLALEQLIGSNIADVFAVIDNMPVAIEVQRSIITVDEIVRRTLGYHRSGVFVLWLALLTEDACFDDYSPSAWERWCHSAYGGRVYFWVQGDKIQPIHFGPSKQRVPEVSWPGAAGRTHTAGGFDRFAKHLRTPDHGKRVHLGSDFGARIRPAYERGTVSVPQCSLFMDRQPIWWDIGR